MQKIIIIIAFWAALLPKSFSQNLILTNDCPYPSKFKIWVNSKYVGTFNLKAASSRCIQIPDNSWVWIEGYTDYRKYKQIPLNQNLPKGKLFKFNQSPQHYDIEFNGFIGTCPCKPPQC